MLRIRVLGHDELIDRQRSARVLEVHGRAEPDTVVRDPVQVHQRDLADTLLQHADASFDQALALLGRLVLGVLTEIAELPRALDLLRQLRLQLAVELLNLVFELLENPGFHVVL